MEIDQKIVEYACLGGAILGGGGGGSCEEGKRMGLLAVQKGRPTLVDINSLPHDATLLTVSAVGAPAAEEKFSKPIDFVRAVEIIKANGVEISGFISCENGGSATLNGWYQSAILNIPVVDAPCNGRAHPLGIMGSMGLHKIGDYVSKQAAVGGNPENGKYLEMFVSSSLTTASKLVRKAAVMAGGMVAVARNPVCAEYVRENGAVGGVRQAIELGKTIFSARSKDDLFDGIHSCIGGEKITEGIIEEKKLQTKDGLDIGILTAFSENQKYEMAFCNEFMCLEKGGKRIATFPDLITAVNLKTLQPLTTAEIKQGDQIAILFAPRRNLKLGSGMKDPALFRNIEIIIGKEMIKYM
ncbi:DUF917 domain-containing protein [Acidobacteriota bacterium]